MLHSPKLLANELAPSRASPLPQGSRVYSNWNFTLSTVEAGLPAKGPSVSTENYGLAKTGRSPVRPNASRTNNALASGI